MRPLLRAGWGNLCFFFFFLRGEHEASEQLNAFPEVTQEITPEDLILYGITNKF